MKTIKQLLQQIRIKFCRHIKYESAYIDRPRIQQVRGNKNKVVKYNIYYFTRCHSCKKFISEKKVKSDLGEKEVKLFYAQREIDYAKI